MKRLIVSFLFLLMSLSFTSCYVYQFNVGNGPQKGVYVKGKNQYFLWGLASGKTTDYKQLAGDSKDYSVTIEHTFMDGFLRSITFGIYTPTSVIVYK